MSVSQTRRQFIRHNPTGFAAAALAYLMHQDTARGDSRVTAQGDHLPSNAALRATHHAAKAKHVIFCYMSGGVSHVDSFDPKPRLKDLHGKPMPVSVQRTQFNNNGNVMASPFAFEAHGESGIEVSSLFPEIANCADDLAVVRSMTTSVNEHAQGNFMMHTGFPFLGHPSAGAWCAYGLGSETDNLPGFVVLQSGSAIPPHGGVGLFSSGYLPAEHQASIIRADGDPPVRNLKPAHRLDVQSARLEAVREMDQLFFAMSGRDQAIDAAIKNYETAFQMQTAVPSLCDLSDESEETLRMYGVDQSDSQLAAYAKQCILARRLIEKGVRFIELSCLTESIGAGGAANPWDQHSDLERGHGAMANQVDRPIAALLKDLKQRGLLDETLVVWAGEFGRTPFSQGSNGRDHNPFGFSVWMAGGGARGGTTFGATDELGYHAVENPQTTYDMWATVLHLMGVDHERLTYRYSGRDFRLTDVHGHVMHEILR